MTLVPRPRPSASRMIRFSCLAAAAVLALMLDGCAVGPDYHAPKVDLPAGFVDAAPAGATISAQDETRWWESFHDPVLTALVERAIAGNLDVKVALARLQEAQTLRSAVVATALPQVGASGASGIGNGSDLTRGKLAPALSAADNRNGTQVVQAIGFDGGWE